MEEQHREQFGSLVRELFRVWRRTLNAKLKPLGLSQAQWVVLMHLSRTPQGLVQTELADKIGIEAPSLVRLLDRMAHAGWVERRVSPHDRRCKLVFLTAKAQSTAAEVERIIRGVRDQLLADVSVEDLRHCERVFSLIIRRGESIIDSA